MKQESKWGDVKELRMAAESLADAIKARTAAQGRVRSGTADPLTGQKLTEPQIKKHPLVAAVIDMEETYRLLLRETYERVVPGKVKEWAGSQPILKSGELFPRIAGLTGNPRYAIPLKIEGEGKDRKAVPDGEPYWRECRCLCIPCRDARNGRMIWKDGQQVPSHCWIQENACRGLRNFYQWCGIGDPDNAPRKGMTQEELLSMGKRTTVRPLIRAFTNQLLLSGARSEDVRDSKYYKLFKETRKAAEGKRHDRVCRNKKIPPLSPNGCGTSAHPEWGEPGSLWRAGHMNNHAHRVAGKAMLKDFWRAAEGTE